MLNCNFCGKSVRTLRGYVLHCKLHRNEPRCLFKCFGDGCKQTFCRYGAFKAHFYRRHNVVSANETVGTAITTFKCVVALCERQCQDTQELIAHLKEHIVEGRAVSCPVRGCNTDFRVKSSFTAHMSRKHRGFTDSSVSNVYIESASHPSTSTPPESGDFVPHCDAGPVTGTDEVDLDISENFSDLYLRNVSLFYLRLQGQFLLPASTIQNIVEEMQNINELGQTYTLSKLSSLLKNDTSLSDEDITKVCESVKGFDLFTACHTGPMRTPYSRVKSFKEKFNYVEPKKMFLGRDENRIDRFAYYVPVRETLKCLLESDLWQNCVSGEHSPESPSDVLSDISDGQIFKNNDFFAQNPSCVKLVLYQDAFEVVNPLGSAKTRHKVLAVYASVANLPLHVRSDIDHMSLVLLCREKDFKAFGHAKVFSELITDLKELEENGIVVSNEIVKGTLFCIAGDNLGSHCIGGFSENFSSSKYFCRYCLINRSDFQGDPNLCGPERTIENYNSAVDRLQTEDTSPHVEGVKFKSVFNSLKYFNVCLPGLPPCLGHDIFEGVLSYDVALYLKYFIKKKAWFTYSILNRRINQFKYCASDASTKPCEVSPHGAKLSGQAVQNWNFLRLLPLIIGDKVKDTADNVWQLTLQLKDIVDMICAQKISVPQVAYLDVLIQEYLESRMALFPESGLKPKHHYLRHYPEMILKFGPLIRLWTMRFESKHSYFKRCARNLKNFKNLCLTLSERHQLLQAYLSAGSMGKAVFQVKNGSPFYSGLYSKAIQDAVRQFDFTETNTKVTVEILYKGTSYKKGQFLVTGNIDSMQFGELVLILIKNDTVHFLMSVYTAEFLSEYHLYSVRKDNEKMQCLNISDLIDFYPLPSYIKDGCQIVPLKHSVLSHY